MVGKSSHKELFICARVDEIVNKIDTHKIQMHYILGISNPADLLTKISADPIRSKLWIHGPELLGFPEQWQRYVIPAAKIDSVPIFCGLVPRLGGDEVLPDVSAFESLVELYSATARSGLQPNVVLQPHHVADAEINWIRNVQRKHYNHVFEFLRELDGVALKSVDGKKIVRSRKITAPSICHSLHLCLDSDGLIRVKTSVANALSLSYDQRFPLLLPVSDPFTVLVIKHNHLKVGHMGLNYTRAHLRRKFWVPSVTCTIKRVVASCDVCKLERGKRYHVFDSPALPEFRFNVDEPWTVTAVDMTGHEWVKSGTDGSVAKVYFIFFVCVATGCGHIEMTPDASSSAFANAFDRFTSRRGVPHMLVSDHGSNFKGYENELKALADDQAMESFLFEKGIVWKFTPIGAPHFNGFIERQIGILKSVIRKSVKNKVLSNDQLLTVACYAESIYNERPLCVTDSDDVDFVPITPNTLVYGRSLRQFAHTVSEIDLNDLEFRVSCKSLNVMSRKLKSTLAQVRKVWQAEYLHFLATKDSSRRARAPSTKSLLMPAVGDVVLIKDSRDFRLGRIVQLFLSEDGECHSARIRTKNGGEGCYPVCNIRLLERGESSKPPESVVRVEGSRNRVQRKAAAKAQEFFLGQHLLSR